MDIDRENDIKERAYTIWEAEGRPSNRADDHWRQAEQEISADGDSVAQFDDESSQPDPATGEPSPSATVAAPSAIPTGGKKKQPA